jgi:1,2-diacylglycerol 3-alpha-glucosyltransferase
MTDGGALRVVIVAESYLPYLSGVTVSTDSLARGLGAAGHEVLVVAPRPVDGAAAPAVGSTGPEPAYAWLPSYQPPPPAPRGYRMPWPVPSAALRAAAAFRPDVVHAQSPFVAGLMGRRLAQRTRAPLVFTHHTRFGDYGHYLGPLARPGSAVVDAYLRDFWAGCAAIVAPGSELADEIRSRLGGRPRPVVRVIPTGVDLDAIRALPTPDLRAIAGWRPDAVVVASLGRLAPEKSVELLVDAFALAAGVDPRLRLLLVGGGPSEAALRDRATRPGLAGRVHLSGQLPRLDAISLIRGADLFAFASRTETQGLVLAEALSAGLPVVALEGPGVRDSVRDGIDGVVVPAQPAGDREARLATAIGALAADPERRSALAAAAGEGAGRFAAARRIEEIVALYREVLRSPG